MSRSCSLLKKIKPMVGNNVSHSNIKTKRRFYPNVHAMNFLSDTLGENLRIKVATRTLRTIYKKGGIDMFLLKTKNRKLTDFALRLKRDLAKIKKEVEKLESSEVDTVANTVEENTSNISTSSESSDNA